MKATNALRSEAARIVRTRFFAGEPVDAIADAYGVSRRAVYRWVASGSRERPSRTVAGRIVTAERVRAAS